MSQVILTAAYTEITTIVHQLSKELNIDVIVLESALDEVIPMIRKSMDREEDSIIISRGATAKLIRDIFPKATLLSIAPTEFDVIKALYELKKYNKKGGILIPYDKEIRYQINHLANILEVDISVLRYCNSKDFKHCIEQAHYEGINILIGGGMRGEKMCAERKIVHIPLLSGRTTIYQALARAKDIIYTRKKEKANSAFVRAVVELSNEGIIALDSEKRVVIFNKMAEILLGKNANQIVGKTLEELDFCQPIHDLLKDNTSLNGSVFTASGKSLLANRAGYNEGVIISLQDVTQIQKSEQAIRRELYKKGLVAKYHFEDIIYKSSVMKEVIQTAVKFSEANSNVLIIGESGTGKELMAQSIHNAQPERKHGPFVAINCTTLTDTLLESELFGYEDGSFTGARKNGKAGLFELAHKGTLFLDEIGGMSLDLQAKLLRVIQEKEVRRIGGDRIIPIDVRIIAASNEDLHNLVQQGKFRLDLFYRLEVLSLKMPSLEERKEDIPLLVEHMFQKYRNIYQKDLQPIDSTFLNQLMLLNWPGNLRQLENVVEKCVVMSEDKQDPNDFMKQYISQQLCTHDNNSFPPEFEKKNNETEKHQLVLPIGTMREMQRYIAKQLLSYMKNKKEVAQTLGIGRTTLWKLLNE